MQQEIPGAGVSWIFTAFSPNSSADLTQGISELCAVPFLTLTSKVHENTISMAWKQSSEKGRDSPQVWRTLWPHVQGGHYTSRLQGQEEGKRH